MAVFSAPLAQLPEVALGCGGIEKYQPVSCFNLAGMRGVQILYHILCLMTQCFVITTKVPGRDPKPNDADNTRLYT